MKTTIACDCCNTPYEVEYTNDIASFETAVKNQYIRKHRLSKTGFDKICNNCLRSKLKKIKNEQNLNQSIVTQNKITNTIKNNIESDNNKNNDKQYGEGTIFYVQLTNKSKGIGKYHPGSTIRTTEERAADHQFLDFNDYIYILEVEERITRKKREIIEKIMTILGRNLQSDYMPKKTKQQIVYLTDDYLDEWFTNLSSYFKSLNYTIPNMPKIKQLKKQNEDE